MAIVPLRSKKTGQVHHLSESYLRVFPKSWEPAGAAVTAGLVEKETEKVVQEDPEPPVAVRKPTKKEAPNA